MANLHDKNTWLFHTPLGVSLFSFSIQIVWEMTMVVDKIVCNYKQKQMLPSLNKRESMVQRSLINKITIQIADARMVG